MMPSCSRLWSALRIVVRLTSSIVASFSSGGSRPTNCLLRIASSTAERARSASLALANRSTGAGPFESATMVLRYARARTMRAAIPMSVDESIEHRYLAIVRLGASLARAGAWGQVAAAVAESVAPVGERRPARLWGRTAEGYEVLGHSGDEFPRV